MRPFSLLVKPASADCNLNCAYCFYLDHAAFYPETRVHRMPPDVVESMIRSYMATPQPQYVFGWQGGEPTLMGLPFFREVVALQQKYGRAGAVVGNGLQTNATLIDDEFARFLAEYRFLLGVSLDGPEEVHDLFRRDRAGQATHAAVLHGIGALKRNRVEFNTLTLVSQANVHRPEDIYHYLCEQGFLFQQYIECVEFAADGGMQPYAIRGPEWGEFLCRVFDLWCPGDTRRVSIRLFDTILARMVDGVANTCQMGGDCRQYFVVEYSGDVFPCDFFVQREWMLGNVRDADWAGWQDSPVYERFGRRKREWSAACGECACRLFCMGDCPKNRVLGSGGMPGLSALCEGWKMFYAHAEPRLRKLAEQVRAERGRQASPKPGARPGRNDVCPCGSGKKFKNCCGGR